MSIVEAVKLCGSGTFDLIVIGHSIPLAERKQLLLEFRRRSTAPVLALHHPGENGLSGADYSFDTTESPAQLLKAVQDIFDTSVKR